MATPTIAGGQFTIGPNNSIAIYVGGQEIDVGVVTIIRWDSRPRIEKRRVNLMSGYTFELPFLQGWEGSFEIQRTGNKLDSVWYNFFEVPYQTGQGYPSVNIIQTIKETQNSGTTRITFQGCILYYDDAGTYENEAPVTQRLSFAAPIRIVS